ncbi:MAG: HU family DNA-binding protein [Nitrospirae bacterium]|nr:HU family DNA-binding protein [Nitrospirota bacterium]
MTKQELIEKVAKSANISKVSSENVIDATINAIKTSLKKGQKVILVGFGTFSVSKRKSRKGRNPRIGEEIKIAACKVPKFSAGKGLKDVVR